MKNKQLELSVCLFHELDLIEASPVLWVGVPDVA